MHRDIWVDFNAADERGQVTTLRKFAESPTSIEVGRTVCVGDDDGNLCQARVLNVDERGRVLLALNYGTFQACSAATAVLV